jgi:hypothetical protein
MANSQPPISNRQASETLADLVVPERRSNGNSQSPIPNCQASEMQLVARQARPMNMGVNRAGRTPGSIS